MVAPKPQQNTAFIPFVATVYETEGLLRLLGDLDLVTRSLFRGKESPISAKARDFTTSSIIGIFEELEKTGLEPTGDQEQAKFLKDLTAYLKQIPIVKVTIAFAPTDTFLMKLNSEISADVGTKIVLDIIINAYIVGGAVFEYEGKVSRQTLDVQLGEVLGKEVSNSKL